MTPGPTVVAHPTAIIVTCVMAELVIARRAVIQARRPVEVVVALEADAVEHGGRGAVVTKSDPGRGRDQDARVVGTFDQLEGHVSRPPYGRDYFRCIC